MGGITFENVDLSWRLIFLKNFLNKQICWPVAAREEVWRGECFVKLRHYAKNMKVGDTMRYFMVKLRCKKSSNEILAVSTEKMKIHYDPPLFIF